MNLTDQDNKAECFKRLIKTECIKNKDLLEHNKGIVEVYWNLKENNFNIKMKVFL